VASNADVVHGDAAPSDKQVISARATTINLVANENTASGSMETTYLGRVR